MTSCPFGNKTSLSRKPCIVAEKFLWITIMNSWSLSDLYKINHTLENAKLAVSLLQSHTNKFQKLHNVHIEIRVL